MDKTKYCIIGIFIIVMLSTIYISQINRESNEKIEADQNFKYEKVVENTTERGNKTPINIRGKLFTGEEPIKSNSDAYWYVHVIFDSNTTEKMAEEIISKYNVPKPYSIKRDSSHPLYYISAPISDFESINNRLEEEDVQLSKKIKVTGGNFTAVVWGISDEVLPRFGLIGIPLRETMSMELVYGPGTPQTESKNIMEQFDRDEKIINTNADIFYG